MESTKSRIRSINTKSKLMVVRRGGSEDLSKIGERNGRYRPPVMKWLSHGNKKQSKRNTVNDTIIEI